MVLVTQRQLFPPATQSRRPLSRRAGCCRWARAAGDRCTSRPNLLEFFGPSSPRTAIFGRIAAARTQALRRQQCRRMSAVTNTTAANRRSAWRREKAAEKSDNRFPNMAAICVNRSCEITKPIASNCPIPRRRGNSPRSAFGSKQTAARSLSSGRNRRGPA